MAEAYISTRCKKILYMIIAAEEYISLKQISEEFKLSKRSIYYELCKINDWLLSQGIPELEVVRGKGIKLSDEMKQRIERAMENGDGKENYIFSPMERVYFIICFIIRSQIAVSVEQLSESLQVSRNTIFNDMRVVVKQLSDYDLHLEYVSKKGYRINGNCIRIRALFILYFNMLKPLYESGVINYIDEEDAKKNFRKLEEIETKLNTGYVDGTLLSIALLIPIMEKNDSDLYFPDLKKEELEGCREYELISEYFPKLEEKEKIYLCLHLLGSRVSLNPVEMFDNRSAQSNYEMAKALVAEFEKVACVVFDNREDLERSLYLHLNTSMYRFQYGIQVGNPMLDDIIREYPELFDLTKIVSHYLEQQIGLPIGDGEVAYFALHFGAHLQKEKKGSEKIRVLIVCSNGISAGNMIKHELLKLIPGVDIVDVVSTKEAVNIHKICDIVITTVKMNCLVPVIVVHPILTDFDRKTILNHSMFRKLNANIDVEALYDRIKKYAPKENHKLMKQELIDFFANTVPEAVPVLDKKKKGMLDVLTENNVSVEPGMITWETAVRNVGRMLVAEEKADIKYIEEIISQTRYYGPYMFITKDVVLAHAKPNGAVYHLGLSMSVYKTPIVFSDYHAAKVIMVLAAKDQEQHLRVLKDIMTVFSIEENAEKMSKMDSAKEIIDFLHKHCEE